MFMANVIAYDTFDLFHIGHLRLLERAKVLAGEVGLLTVAIPIAPSTEHKTEIRRGV